MQVTKGSIANVTGLFFLFQFCVYIFVSTGCESSNKEAVVAGASMFPGCVGEHYQICCSDCLFEFRIDASLVPASSQAVCPNCGYTGNDFRDLPVNSSSLYELDKATTPLRRWEIVAFAVNANTSDSLTSRLAIKRVVGLPGEKLKIANGNIFINGQFVEKPVGIQEQLLLPVFDSSFQPENGINRWRSDQKHSGWNIESGKLTFTPTVSKISQWLTYQHVRGYRHVNQRSAIHAIEDSYAYNQNFSRSLNEIFELKVEASLDRMDSAVFSIKFDFNNAFYEAEFDFRNQQVCLKGNELARSSGWADKHTGTVNSVAVTNIDGWFRARVNGIAIAEMEIKSNFSQQPLQLQIGNRGSQIDVNRIRIWRDVYYLQGRKSSPPASPQWNLSNDECFVLGDNSPVSIDSRSHGPVKLSSIVGKVSVQR